MRGGRLRIELDVRLLHDGHEGQVLADDDAVERQVRRCDLEVIHRRATGVHLRAEVLELADVEDPVPGPGQVRVDVYGTALNRADLLQRRGLYPPPPGASARPALIALVTISSFVWVRIRSSSFCSIFGVMSGSPNDGMPLNASAA